MAWYTDYFDDSGRCILCKNGKPLSPDFGNRKKHITCQHSNIPEVAEQVKNEKATKEVEQATSFASKKPQTLMDRFMTKKETPEISHAETVLLLFATEFMPYSLANNPLSQKLFSSVSGKYRLPCRQTLSKEMSKNMEGKVTIAQEWFALVV
eukprot:GILI01015521.1.p1 GENE.GILI01015521.1~~GILI01015521.1.p1  ORF type:complete len:152 (-),score=6.13 GILI01015521.1:79-534(-)